MLALFLFISFGLIFGYFATLNTAASSISFGVYTFEQVPLYLIVIASFAIGVLFSSIFYMLQSVSARLILGKKGKELESEKKEVAELMKRVHQLELENTKLKAKHGDIEEDEDSL